MGTTMTKEMEPAADDCQDVIERCWRCIPLPEHDYAAMMSVGWLDLAAMPVRRLSPDAMLTMRRIRDKYWVCETPEQIAMGLYASPKLASVKIHDNRNVRASADVDGLALFCLNRPEIILARGALKTTTTTEIQPAADDCQSVIEFCWQCVPLPKHDFAAVISYDWLDLAAVTIRRLSPDELLTTRQIRDKYCLCDTSVQTAATLYVSSKLDPAKVNNSTSTIRKNKMPPMPVVVKLDEDQETSANEQLVNDEKIIAEVEIGTSSIGKNKIPTMPDIVELDKDQETSADEQSVNDEKIIAEIEICASSTGKNKMLTMPVIVKLDENQEISVNEQSVYNEKFISELELCLIRTYKEVMNMSTTDVALNGEIKSNLSSPNTEQPICPCSAEVVDHREKSADEHTKEMTSRRRSLRSRVWKRTKKWAIMVLSLCIQRGRH